MKGTGGLGPRIEEVIDDSGRDFGGRTCEERRNERRANECPRERGEESYVEGRTHGLTSMETPFKASLACAQPLRIGIPPAGQIYLAATDLRHLGETASPSFFG